MDFLKNFVISFSLKLLKMETSIVDILLPISYLAKFWFWSYGPKCCHSIKLLSWHYQFWCVQPVMPKEPKIRSLHIFAISPEKNWVEVDFLPANEFESFLQVDRITVCLPSQACPKYPKQSLQYLCNISRKRERWTWSFAYR